MMTHLTGKSKEGVLRVDFDRRLKLEIHASKVTSDAGLLPYRELEDVLGLAEVAGEGFADRPLCRHDGGPSSSIQVAR